ncbi:membrane protein [Geothrix oryzae]|uniref:Membrane protein n=1 Tax=Geothrix oryzae TaxID=2927975 RepID=A0ABM8DTZ7_9BACT|nr:EamA family transporter [Geothrix oryzae]BDU70554.1 membrane protein [Geothrix oryzae]
MAPAALGLTLASALLHAVWNALLKRSKNLDDASVVVFATALVVTALLAFVWPGPAFPRAAALGWALAAGVGEGGYFIGLVGSLERAPLGWSYTWMRGGALLVAWPVGLLLGERIDGLAIFAVAGMLGGLGLLGLSTGERGSRRALPYVLGAAGSIAWFNACYKLALGAGASPPALFATSMAVGLPIQALHRRVRRGTWTGPVEWRPALGAGLLCTAAFLCYLVALRISSSAAVLTLRNTSIVFTLLLGWALGERPRGRQVAGVVLVSLGAALLGWPR